MNTSYCILSATVAFAMANLAFAVTGDSPVDAGQTEPAISTETERATRFADYECAKARAAARGTKLILLFTGSDWCVWCKRLEKEVLSKPEFLDMATNEFEYAVLDFPSEKKQDEQVTKRNNALSDKYGVKGFPTILVVDPVSGDELYRTGYAKGGAEKWVEDFKDGFAKAPLIKAHLAAYEAKLHETALALSSKLKGIPDGNRKEVPGAAKKPLLEAAEKFSALAKELQGVEVPAEIAGEKAELETRCAESVKWLQALAAHAKTEKAYLFAYFSNKDHGGRKGQAAGLHLAYSNDGRNWTALNGDRPVLVPEVGKDKLMRDPSICQGPDGTFHLVWTSSWTDKIIGHASSKDLVNWSEQRAIPVMTHEKDARNSWAPEVTYNPDDSLFYIYWASTIPGRHSPIKDMDKKENGYNHRIYVTTTKDWQTFSPTRIWFNPPFSAIDAALLRLENAPAKWLFAVKNENHTPPEKNIRTLFLDSLEGELPTEVSESITPNWVEGPSPLQVGDTIYIYYDCYTKHAYGAVKSEDMGKTWQDASGEVSFPKDARHGTAFAVDKDFVESLKAALL